MSGTITDRFHSLFIFQITIFSLCVLLEEVVVSDKHAHSGTAESSYCTWAASLAKALSQSLLVSYREIQSGESAPVLCADDWHMEQNGQYLVWWNQRNVKYEYTQISMYAGKLFQNKYPKQYCMNKTSDVVQNSGSKAKITHTLVLKSSKH